MDLLEYQVKEWFSKIGIPVLPSQRIDHPTDLKRLKIRYPIVLKSQVQAGEREKAGGVRIVETTIDAIAGDNCRRFYWQNRSMMPRRNFI
jgi:succinyl-CoA synthetase beta subunit